MSNFSLDLNIQTGITLLLSLLCFSLLLWRKAYPKKEFLFFVVLFTPTLNTLIVGDWYFYSINNLSRYILSGGFLYLLTTSLQLVLFILLFSTKNLKSKLKYANWLLIAVILIQAITVLSIFRSESDVSLYLEPFCFAAYILQLLASVLIVRRYRNREYIPHLSIICNKCYQINDSDAKYCSSCGNQL